MNQNLKPLYLQTMTEIDTKSRKLERERILSMFQSLAKQMDVKADEDESEAGLVWVAAAASIRRVCDEANQTK